jgi:Zn-dependent protease/predicted transcriptional regulator
MGALGAVGLFLSIILHELGHSVVSRKQGMPMKGITLFIFGGVAEMNEEPRTARAEFRMAIIGPVISVVLGGTFYLIYRLGSLEQWSVPVCGILFYLFWINLLLAAFNMIPAFPLDGGRVLRSYLWKRNGNLRKATHTASRIGLGFGGALIALGVVSILFGSFIGGLWWLLIGWFLRNAAKASFMQMEIRTALKGETVDRFMNREPVTVPAGISLQELVQDYFYVHHFQMFPVVRDSKIVGCISTREIKQVPKSEWDRHSVQELLVPCGEQNTVSPGTDAMDVLAILERTGRSRLLVMDKGRLIGLISLKDLLRFLSLRLDLDEGEGTGLYRESR